MFCHHLPEGPGREAMEWGPPLITTKVPSSQLQDSPGTADSIWQLPHMRPLAVGSFLMLSKWPSN
ncbi:hypothetical protein EK904_008897, partial [Melospiza melodia maxima]